jgi:hypothetical protein
MGKAKRAHQRIVFVADGWWARRKIAFAHPSVTGLD